VTAELDAAAARFAADRDAIAGRLASVRGRIAQAAERAGRDPGAVTLVAVSKTFSIERIRAAIAAGVTDLGENRVQEAQGKIPALKAAGVRWHLIGHLQSNKARSALALFDVIHSVDTLALAEALSRRLAAASSDDERRLDVLFEVNAAGEATKQGFAPDALLAEAPALAALPRLRPRGLMTIAPQVADPEDARPVFRALRELRDRLAPAFAGPFHDLSMGMSHDYPVAVEEGATLVRIGTAIFGARAPQPTT
jgi:PLP dependent protein